MGKGHRFSCAEPRLQTESRYIEVKTDLRLYETGNLYIELENTHSKEGKGWFNFSEADIIAYCNYGAPAKEIYLFSFDDLRTVIENGEWLRPNAVQIVRGYWFP